MIRHTSRPVQQHAVTRVPGRSLCVNDRGHATLLSSREGFDGQHVLKEAHARTGDDGGGMA
jgi:hypothetical protein